MDPTIRLRIATRIHFALLRQYGEDVAVSTLLGGEGEAREALWVCEASTDAELVGLAKQFKAMPKPMPAIAPRGPTPSARQRGATPQEMAWAQDTSGFGVTRAPQTIETPDTKPAPRSALSRWLRGSAR